MAIYVFIIKINNDSLERKCNSITSICMQLRDPWKSEIISINYMVVLYIILSKND